MSGVREGNLHTFVPWESFHSSIEQRCSEFLHCSFSRGPFDNTLPDGTSKPKFVAVPIGKAEDTLSTFAREQQANKHLSACFLTGSKVAKSKAVYPWLKGMRVILQGTKGPDVPYSYVVYHAGPKFSVSFAQAFSNRHLAMLFHVNCTGVKGVALVDTGATHSFVRQDFLATLGVRLSKKCVDVQLADGQTMRSAGTAKLRVHLSQTYVEQRDFIVCETLLDGVDLILGEDFLKERKALIDYNHGAVHLKPPHSSHYITLLNPLPPSERGTLPAQKVNVISEGQARRAMRKGCPGFWGVVREARSGQDSVCATHYLHRVAVATTEGDNPWDEDSGATGLNLNENSRRVIEGMTDKPQDLKQLLLEFLDVFPEKLPDLPPDRGILHTIPMTPGHTPPCRPTYRLAEPEVAECRRQVEELLAQGFIRPSASPYGSPILFVRKKDGTFRMVIDYRAVNNLTRKDKYPLPRIDDLLDKLQGSKFFTSFDLLSGYHQVRLHESDVPKTAFRTPLGSFEFLVLPFGLTNAPSTFQRLMNSVFHDFIREGFVVVYLDDLLVYSKSREQHLEHLTRILTRLREEKLYAKLSKCEFFADELRYLGHVVGRDGIKVDPAKVRTIVDWPTPTGSTHVRQFLGLANYFRKFVPGYSTLAAPLTRLTGKVPWTWGEAEEHAFQSLKETLSNAPVLALPDSSKPFKVISDASDYGVGAVLLQEGRPVAYFSKKLSNAERNYSTTEKELAGVLYALKEWRCYLLGQTFTVVTDHRANSFLQTQTLLSPRRARWAEFLQLFDIQWEYAPGSTNPADPLSRSPHLAGAHVRALARAQAGVQASVQARAGPLGEHSPPVGVGAMGVGEAADSTTLPTPMDGLRGWGRVLSEAYEIDDWLHRKQNRRKLSFHSGLWKRGARIYVPSHHMSSDGVERNLRREILENLHGPPIVGHPGRDRTLELVQRSWWWPGMASDVADFVAQCDSCQRVKAPAHLPVGLLHPLEIPDRKWQSMSMDLITGLPRTKEGYDAIWVAVDRLSKYAHFAPTTTDASAEVIAQLLRTRVFTLHGFPTHIVSDRDPRWVGRFCQELFRLTGCRSALSTAFHPQTDGQTERINRILEDYLRHYVTGRHNDWDKHLCEAEFSYNNTFQQSINTTPFRLTFGQDPTIPFQEVYEGVTSSVREYVPAAAEFVRRMRWDLERARTCLKAAQDRMKAYADARRKDAPILKIGQPVLLSTKNLKFKHTRTRKLLPRFIGPFPIVQEVSSVAFRIRLPKTLRVHDVFHVSMLKPYKEGGTVQPPPLPEIIDGEEEYEVEAVLAHRERKLRGRKTAREYLEKWTGYQDIHNTWEPEDNLEHAREALQRYWDLTTEHRPEQKEKVDKKRKGRGKNAEKQRQRARRA